MGARRGARGRAVYSRRRGGVCAAAGCSGSRRLRLCSPARSPPWAVGTARSARRPGRPGGWGRGGRRWLACRGARGVGCPPAGAGPGEGRLEVLLGLLRRRAAWAPPACAGRGEAGPRRQKEDGGWRRRRNPFPKPRRTPAQTAALVWSGCLYPFDMTS